MDYLSADEKDLIKAAAGGTPAAQFELGCYYEDKDKFKDAKKYYELAADQDFPPAIHNLACLYERGQGMKADISKAVELYERAVESGYAPSHVNLARLYIIGDEALPQDFGMALSIVSAAAEDEDAEAQIMLGNMFENGMGVPKNDDVALTWYQRANRNSAGSAQANIDALEQRRASAESGELPDWMSGYVDMAESGDASAMYSIGYMYYLGQAIPQDYAKAIEWFEKAAEKNFDFALFFLGECYNRGQGVPADAAKAAQYYKRAADLGNENAKAALKSL